MSSVVLRGHAEVRAQDVVAHVEEDLGTELEATLGGPGVAEALGRSGRCGATELFEA
jgi:hypothetical protein